MHSPRSAAAIITADLDDLIPKYGGSAANPKGQRRLLFAAGRPYVSLVVAACDSHASPLLLLSDLAQHTKNLLAEPAVSLLFEDVAGHADPLAGPRLTLLGRAERYDEPRVAARFTARHPASA